MKRILSIVTAAAVLAVTLTGCSLFPLSEKEYKKQVTELICDYYSVYGEAIDDFRDDTSSVFTGELVDIDDALDVFADAKEPLEEEFKKADEYLDKIEKLNPPKEMEDFHDDFLSFVKLLREAQEKLLAVCDAKSEEKLESAAEKSNTAAEKLAEAYEELSEEYDWFVEELEDSEFMEAMTSNINYAKESDVMAANATARSLKRSVDSWMANLYANGYTLPSESVITIEGKSKNREWSGDVSAPGFSTRNGGNEEAVKWLKNSLGDDFDFKEDISAVFWVSGKRLVGCAYSTDLSTDKLEQMFTIEDFNSGEYEWTGKIDGMTKKGEMVGTYPILTKK